MGTLARRRVVGATVGAVVRLAVLVLSLFAWPADAREPAGEAGLRTGDILFQTSRSAASAWLETVAER